MLGSGRFIQWSVILADSRGTADTRRAADANLGVHGIRMAGPGGSSVGAHGPGHGKAGGDTLISLNGVRGIGGGSDRVAIGRKPKASLLG